MEKVYGNLNVEQMIYFNKLWVCLIIENNAVKHLIHLFCLIFCLDKKLPYIWQLITYSKFRINLSSELLLSFVLLLHVQVVDGIPIEKNLLVNLTFNVMSAYVHFTILPFHSMNRWLEPFHNILDKKNQMITLYS